MISEMYADLLLPILPSLREATDEPVDTDSLAKDSGNKDLANDAKDAKSDKDDVASDADTDADDDSPEDTEDKDDTDDAPDDEADETPEDTDPDDGGDSDDASDEESTEDKEQSTEDKGKKLALYESLREIRTSHSSVGAVLEALSSKTDLPSSALELIKVLRNKVAQNIDSLDELLTNVKFVTSRSYAEILVVHNIYISDLRMIDSNLGKYNRYLKSTSEKTANSKSKK